MRTQKRLIVEQLDKKLSKFYELDTVQVPDKGWLHSIRTTLNMTLEQLGKRLNKTKQAIKRVELSEAEGSVSIGLLKETAAALNMKLVYGFIPTDGSIDKLIENRASELATKIVMRTHQNMVLENQGLQKIKIEKAIKELTDDFKQELNKSLWD